MGAVTIKLSQRYEAHGATFDTISMREPTGADYWSLGPVAEWQPAGDGQALVTYHPVLRAYAERLAIVPDMTAVAALAVLSLPDALRVERAVKDFFTEANRSIAPPTS